MDQEMSSVKINGLEYVLKSDSSKKAETFDGLEYVIIRANHAGVFAGYLESRENSYNCEFSTVILKQARRLWYWAGAASLSELAVEGVASPKECKFPVELSTIDVFGVIEIIPCTEKARLSIASVPIWSGK